MKNCSECGKVATHKCVVKGDRPVYLCKEHQKTHGTYCMWGAEARIVPLKEEK